MEKLTQSPSQCRCTRRRLACRHKLPTTKHSLLLSKKLATNTAHNRVDLLDCSDCIMALNRNQRSVLSDSPIQACPEEILASIISRVDADSR